jgi:hypothetical protein
MDTLDQIRYICQQQEEFIRNKKHPNPKTVQQKPAETGESHDEQFIKKFGMSKQEKIDTWIVMSQEELVDELNKYEIAFNKNDYLLGVLMKQTDEPKQPQKSSLFKKSQLISDQDKEQLDDIHSFVE